MGWFDFLSGETKEKRTQVFFYDDGSFEFIKRPFEDSCLVDKKDNENIIKAWKHFYSNELRFDGYGKKIGADMVTLGFDRDIILDPFNKVGESKDPNSGKPSKDSQSIFEWAAKVATTARHKIISKPGSMMIWEKITLFLGAGLLMELLIWGIQMATKG